MTKDALHPAVYEPAAPNFQAGKYSQAVFDAFRPVEMLVRDIGKFGKKAHGRKLMAEAFKVCDPNGKRKAGLSPPCV